MPLPSPVSRATCSRRDSCRDPRTAVRPDSLPGARHAFAGSRPRPLLLACATLLLIGLAVPLHAGAQTLSVLDGAVARLIGEEVSGDAAYETIRTMTQWHRANGTPGLWRSAEYIAEQARAAGLEDVRVIRQAGRRPAWSAQSAELWIEGTSPMRVASMLESRLHLADYSRAADVTAELVDVGGGTTAELDGAGVRGKVVLTHGSLYGVMAEAVGRRGALGVVWYPDPYSGANGIVGAGVSRPDQIRWTRIPTSLSEGDPTWAFVLSLRQGIDLRNRLAAADEPVTVRARVDAAFDELAEPWQVMVEAFLPGSDPTVGQDIVLVGHLQEEKWSANDDASGVAGILEAGRALSRLIGEGRLERPARNLRFWWVTEIGSQRQFFADHPDSPAEMWVAINQDMVGADQSQDILRKQNITRLPATRFHFFNDVVESVIDWLVAGNTFELAQLQAGHPLYPIPHLAHGGSMDRFNAEMIWFHNNSDHMTFTEAPIGIPAVSFTNMPDRFIHSSDDDLWNVDPTQLGRNAFAAALIAYIMATAGEDDLPVLAAETVGRGDERLGHNLRLALRWLVARPGDGSAYFEARDQIEYAVARERLALASLRDLGPAAHPVARELLGGLERRGREALREVDDAWRRGAGRPPPERRLTDVERQLEAIRPVLVAGPEEFLTARGRARSSGLHSLMAFEVLNAVDGVRTGLAIARFVAAEAREAGPHYYGTVEAGHVLAYLRSLEKTGLVRLD
jgi:hypothetical protein